MVLLILAVLWVAVLVPGFMKKRSERQSVTSIDSFHHQLHLLERTGPKLVPPACRLEAVGAGALYAARSARGLPTITSTPGRPKLVLLERPDNMDGLEAGRDTAGYDEQVPPEVAGGAGPGGEVGNPSGEASMSPGRGVAPLTLAAPRRSDVYERRRALKRRRDLFGILAFTFVFSALLGMVHAFRILWVATLLSGLALVAYVTLMVYARRITLEQRAARRARGAVRSSARPIIAGAGSLRRLSGPGARDRDEMALYRASSRAGRTAELNAYLPVSRTAAR